MKLPSEWSDLLELLCAERVRFLIVGAHALAAHGRPRATGDLDVLIEPTPQNARLGAVLDAFGYTAQAREAHMFAEPQRMATLGHPPYRVDLLTSITGVSFAQAWKGRVRVKLGCHMVGVLGRRELIANKRAAARPQDLVDVAALAEVRPKAVGSSRTTPRDPTKRTVRRQPRAR
jgi:hypothetical protein